jgi:hypothetical protein
MGHIGSCNIEMTGLPNIVNLGGIVITQKISK